MSISLDQRIDNATVIFEGKVTSKTSFWNQSHTRIYTSNVVDVYKVFKGSLVSAQVEIITDGGIVGKNMQIVTNTLQLDVGNVGIFTAIPGDPKLSQRPSLLQLKTYAGIQGFIRYNLRDHSASDPFTKYKSITNDVYPAITGRTKSRTITIKEADYKIN
ncbi:MAG TPA: hypothetical protein VFE53_25150 [Mucilaginibacter sp.]|jgi:hypothetical protein|nr:hypothetical protein [Mucilaginibacter sp.]